MGEFDSDVDKPQGGSSGDASGAASDSERAGRGEFDAGQAQARIDAGESAASVAQSYGLTTRGLKNRLTRAARGGDRARAAREAIGGAGGSASPVGRAAAPKAPAQEGSAEELTDAQRAAIKAFEQHVTPQTVVQTIDGFQTSLTAGICYLARVPLDAEQRAMIPFMPEEKAALEPWAAFAMIGISDELKKDPSLGLKAFLAVLAATLARRGVMIAVALKANRELKRSKHVVRPIPSEPQTDGTASPSVAGDAGA